MRRVDLTNILNCDDPDRVLDALRQAAAGAEVYVTTEGRAHEASCELGWFGFVLGTHAELARLPDKPADGDVVLVAALDQGTAELRSLLRLKELSRTVARVLREREGEGEGEA